MQWLLRLACGFPLGDITMIKGLDQPFVTNELLGQGLILEVLKALKVLGSSIFLGDETSMIPLPNAYAQINTTVILNLSRCAKAGAFASPESSKNVNTVGVNSEHCCL